MWKLTIAAALLVSIGCSAPAAAWSDEGHMQIAAGAYRLLTPAVKAEVDRLVRLNPDYPSWVKTFPADKVDLYAFVRASTWADDIEKKDHGYRPDDFAPGTASDFSNFGYADKYQHKNWHYRGIGFTTGNFEIPLKFPANVAAQITVFATALRPGSLACKTMTPKRCDDLRSYDLVWLINLAGDAHQPLHSLSRFFKVTAADGTEQIIDDKGGDSEIVKPVTGEKLSLQDYWDHLLGGDTAVASALLNLDHDPLPIPDAAEAANLEPLRWSAESAALASKYAYAEPVLSGTSPTLDKNAPAIELDQGYETNARTTARQRAGLAAVRLANLLNQALQ